MFDKTTIEDLFRALGKQIDIMKKGQIEIVVCGGASLNVLMQIKRTTKDIDILGVVNKGDSGKINIVEASLPQWFKDVSEIVRKDFNLPANWINIQPTSVINFGLPQGFEKRLTKKSYSKDFHVYFISRLDQIHFKLYASVDRGGRHVDDLLSLKPTGEELEMAARWSMTHDVSEGFRLILKELLKELGFKNVSETI